MHGLNLFMVGLCNFSSLLGTLQEGSVAGDRGAVMKRRTILKKMLVIGVWCTLLFMVRTASCADVPTPLVSETVRPSAEAGPTKVSVGVWFADISRIDSASQTFSANLVTELSWRDPKLAHNQSGPKKYNIKDIWTPNLIAVNASAKLVPSLPEIAEAEGDGTVHYRQRFIGTFSQKLDLHTFPFDRADFRIHFVAAGYLPHEIMFVPSHRMVAAGMQSGAGIAPDLTLQDWRITGLSAHSLTYRVVPGIEYGGYALEFQAHRDSKHYIVKVIIPLVLIVMMSWTAFWIDPSLGAAQISVATTSMLTLIAYRFAVGAEVPKLPYLTRLDAFILCSSILVFLTLIEVIITTRLSNKSRLDVARVIDRYSRVLFPGSFLVIIWATLYR
jgi:hypothetical protein